MDTRDITGDTQMRLTKFMYSQAKRAGSDTELMDEMETKKSIRKKVDREREKANRLNA